MSVNMLESFIEILIAQRRWSCTPHLIHMHSVRDADCEMSWIHCDWSKPIRLWKVDSLSFFSAESHMVNRISATQATCLRVYTELCRLTNSLCLNKKDSEWDVCGWGSELQWDCLTRWECMYFCILQMRVRVLCGLCTASFCPLLIAAHFPSLVKEWDDWQWWLHKNSRSIYINENVWKQAEPLIWAKGTVRRERSLTNSASAFWWLMIN